MRQGHAASVFQCIEGFGVLVEFQQFDFGVVFGKEGIGGGAFVDQQGLVFQLGDVGNRLALGRYHAQSDFHVGRGEIDGFRAFRRLGEVGQQNVHFAGTDVFDAVGGFGKDEFDFVRAAEQVFGHFFGNFDIKALVFAIRVHIAERRFVAEYADADNAFFFDGGHCIRPCGGRLSARGGLIVGTAVAGSQSECDNGTGQQCGEFFGKRHDLLL